MKKTLLLILFAIMLFSGVSCTEKEEPSQDTIKSGQSVPEGLGLPVTDISFIAFFNSKCPDCQQEMPVIQELYDKYCGALNFLVIGRDMTVQQIKDYFNENDFYAPFQADPDRKIFDAFGGKCIPLCFLCKDGIIKNVWTDNPIMTVKEFEKAYEKLK